MTGNLLTMLKKNRLSQGVFRRLHFYAFGRSLGQIAPLAVRKSEHSFRRLNLVLTTINREHIFGGIATALQLYRGLAAELGDDVRLRIILTEYSPGRDDLADFAAYRVVGWDDDLDHPAQILPAKYRSGHSLPVTSGDVFLATQWVTAYLAQRAVLAQSALYGTPLNRLCYLVQDYEPGFYPFSSEYTLCESTYRAALPQVVVFNSSFLRDYFKEQKISFHREFCFEPRLNARLKAQLASGPTAPKKRQILIYGRPSTPRNAFPLLVEGLRRWAGPKWSGWQVFSAGEKHPDIALGDGITLSSVGKLSLDQYARLLQETAVGVSLMISPHPSYPPLEMAHFGALTVSNRFAGKDLSRWHDNIVSLDQCTPESIAAALSGQCERFQADPEVGLRGLSRAPGYLEDALPFAFLPELARELFP
jgi:O-antigen biosynthesis protein